MVVGGMGCIIIIVIIITIRIINPRAQPLTGLGREWLYSPLQPFAGHDCIAFYRLEKGVVENS